MSKISMSIINQHKDMFMISAASTVMSFQELMNSSLEFIFTNNEQRFDSFYKNTSKNINLNKIYGIYDPGNITYTKTIF